MLLDNCQAEFIWRTIACGVVFLICFVRTLILFCRQYGWKTQHSVYFLSLLICVTLGIRAIDPDGCKKILREDYRWISIEVAQLLLCIQIICVAFQFLQISQSATSIKRKKAKKIRSRLIWLLLLFSAIVIPLQHMLHSYIAKVVKLSGYSLLLISLMVVYNIGMTRICHKIDTDIPLVASNRLRMSMSKIKSRLIKRTIEFDVLVIMVSALQFIHDILTLWDKSRWKIQSTEFYFIGHLVFVVFMLFVHWKISRRRQFRSNQQFDDRFSSSSTNEFSLGTSAFKGPGTPNLIDYSIPSSTDYRLMK
eukprot:TRINITY_DN5813_c0_g1_i1.p1 TRINITY_DN5813_c0_g1~~TRINITY_DN5813_c0_g1_i1.p1  ORF type:complete len:307 (+),score=27.95 TRINITY_DN5813_c0_g1_i1:130-1050(+)